MSSSSAATSRPWPVDEVRAGEVDLLLALVGDRVRADVVVDVAVHDRLLAVRRRDRLVLDLVLARSRARRRSSGRSRCRSRSARRCGVEVAEAGLVLLDADDDLAALGIASNVGLPSSWTSVATSTECLVAAVARRRRRRVPRRACRRCTRSAAAQRQRVPTLRRCRVLRMGVLLVACPGAGRIRVRVVRRAAVARSRSSSQWVRSFERKSFARSVCGLVKNSRGSAPRRSRRRP